MEFLAGLGERAGTRRERLLAAMALLEQHEDGLREHLEAGLAELPGVDLSGRAQRTGRPPCCSPSTGTPPRTPSGSWPGAANAPAGHFYVIEASRWLGLGDTGGFARGSRPTPTPTTSARCSSGLREFLAVR